MVRTLIDAIGLGLSIFIGAVACGVFVTQIISHRPQENALQLVIGAVLGAVAGGSLLVRWTLGQLMGSQPRPS